MSREIFGWELLSQCLLSEPLLVACAMIRLLMSVLNRPWPAVIQLLHHEGLFGRGLDLVGRMDEQIIVGNSQHMDE